MARDRWRRAGTFTARINWMGTATRSISAMPFRRGGCGALPRGRAARRQGAHSIHREAELPEVFVVLHAVRLRWAAQTGTGSGVADARPQRPGIRLQRGFA